MRSATLVALFISSVALTAAPAFAGPTSTMRVRGQKVVRPVGRTCAPSATYVRSVSRIPPRPPPPRWYGSRSDTIRTPAAVRTAWAPARQSVPPRPPPPPLYPTVVRRAPAVAAAPRPAYVAPTYVPPAAPAYAPSRVRAQPAPACVPHPSPCCTSTPPATTYTPLPAVAPARPVTVRATSRPLITRRALPKSACST
jgi:hypothetical protein